MSFGNSIPLSASPSSYRGCSSAAIHSPRSPRVRRPVDAACISACRQLERTVESVADLLPVSGVTRAFRHQTGCRQITLYLCHVMLGVSQAKIARIFGMPRTTVRESCQAVENRRDDLHLDIVLEIIGRLAVRNIQSAGARDEA